MCSVVGAAEMTVPAVGQAAVGSGLRRTAGVCGEGGCEGDESGPVGVESRGAAVVAAAASDAVKDGACATGWISQYRALRGRSGAQRLGVAGSGGGMGAASAGLAVCDGRCPLRSFHHCQVRLVCPLRQLRLCWRSERGSAPTCLTKTQQSSV